MAPGVELASKRNKDQEYFLGGKCARRIQPKKLASMSENPGSLNLLEPSGTI